MLRFLIIFLLVCFPVFAQDFYKWGNANPSSGLIKKSDDHFADIVIENKLSEMVSDVVTFNLYLQKQKFGVLVEHGKGNFPDKITVFCPPGFYAEPKEITLDENKIGIIKIYAMLLG